MISVDMIPFGGCPTLVAFFADRMGIMTLFLCGLGVLGGDGFQITR
jgi:hypothetical protein